MAGTEDPIMAGIQTLQHIDGLLPSDFADDDPVGTHSQGRADQVTDRHLAVAFGIRPSRLQPDQIADTLDLKLGIVFDRDDALILRNKV